MDGKHLYELEYTLPAPEPRPLPAMATARAVAGIVVVRGLFAVLCWCRRGRRTVARRVLLGVLLGGADLSARRRDRVKPRAAGGAEVRCSAAIRCTAGRVLALVQWPFAGVVAFCPLDVFHLRLLPLPPAGAVSFAASSSSRPGGGSSPGAEDQRVRGEWSCGTSRSGGTPWSTPASTPVGAATEVAAGSSRCCVGMCLGSGRTPARCWPVVPVAILAVRTCWRSASSARRSPATTHTPQGRWRLVPTVGRPPGP